MCVQFLARLAKCSIAGVDTMVSLPDATIRTGTLTFSVKATELIAWMELDAAETQPRVGVETQAKGRPGDIAGALEDASGWR